MEVQYGDKTIKLTIYWWTDNIEGLSLANTGELVNSNMACWSSGTVNIKPNKSRGIVPRSKGWTFNSLDELPGACMAALNWAHITVLASRGERRKMKK